MNHGKPEEYSNSQIGVSKIYRFLLQIAKLFGFLLQVYSVGVGAWRLRYPLVNIQKAMENHHVLMGNSTISMAIFHCYVNLPEGIPNLWLS